MLRRLSRVIGGAAAGAIGVHLVASILHNTPDSYNLDLRPYTAGWPIPGWRFFAPNPGTQNVHLLVRTTSKAGFSQPFSEWRDVTPEIQHSPWNALVNPKSRGPKALFDAMQQLSAMKANYSAFDFLVSTLPYRLIADWARALIHDAEAHQFQFLLLNYFPSAPETQRMQPLLVSEWLDFAGDEEGEE